MNSKRIPTTNGPAVLSTGAEERQAQALYDCLHGTLPQDAPDIPANEAALGKALCALAEENHPNEKFDARLQEMLQAEARRRRTKAAFGRVGRSLGWAVALFILIVGLGWAIRTLLPQPAAIETGEVTVTETQEEPGVATATPVRPEGSTATPPGCAPTSYVVVQGDTLLSIASLFGVTPETILATNQMIEPMIYVGQVLVIPVCEPGGITPTLTPEAEPLQIYTSPLMPDLEIAMQAEFPETPAEMVVYEQIPWPTLTLDAARQVASQLGLPGAAYKPARQNPWDTIFVFTDGFKRVDFTNNVYQFYYVADYSAALNGDIPLPLTTAQIAESETYLKERGLLDFPYQVEDTAYSGQTTGVAAFVQMLDGFAIRVSGFYGPRVSVLADSHGKVKTIDGFRVDYKALGAYGIRSAEDAWQKAIAPDMPMGVEMNTHTPLSIPARWQRTYPMGQPVTIYGRVEILQPAEPGGAAQLFLESVPLRGIVNGIAQLSEDQQFIQAKGQYQPGETGERVFVVENWQVSPLSLDTIVGLIKRQEGQVYLEATDRRLRLLDVPDALLNGTQIMVNGVVLGSAATGEEPLLEWSWIYSQPFGGGGGGGGISFLDLNLSGPPVATPTPYPMPTVQAGQRLEGVTGNPIVTLREYEDGSRRIEVDLYIAASAATSDDWPDGLSLRLQGPAVEGIEAYHLLPVRIWGTLTGKTAGMIVYLDLERFEPVYPGVKMQAWMGQFEVVTLEGKKVVRLMAQDGQQYIVNSSLLDENSTEWMPLGETVIVEGAVFPDQSFAGYPILQDVRFIPAGGIQDLSQYQMQYAIPRVVKEAGSASQPRRAVIEKIELVYHTAGLPGPGEENTGIVYIQPMWRFVGHYPDGTLFEILVQALLDEYLKPWE